MLFPYYLHYQAAASEQCIYIQKEKTTLGFTPEKDIFLATLCAPPPEPIYFIQSFSELFLVFEGASESVFINGAPITRKSLLPSDQITFSFLPDQMFTIERNAKPIHTMGHPDEQLEEHLFELLSAQLKEQQAHTTAQAHSPSESVWQKQVPPTGIPLSNVRSASMSLPSIKPKMPPKSLFLAPHQLPQVPPDSWAKITMLNGKNAHAFLFLTQASQILHIQKSIFMIYQYQENVYLEHLYGEPPLSSQESQPLRHYQIFDKQIFQIEQNSFQFSLL